VRVEQLVELRVAVLVGEEGGDGPREHDAREQQREQRRRNEYLRTGRPGAVGRHHVADAANRANEVGRQLAPQVVHVHFDGVALDAAIHS